MRCRARDEMSEPAGAEETLKPPLLFTISADLVNTEHHLTG